MGALPKGGAMAAIEASEEEVEGSIKGRDEELAIAAINGPTSTVISGTEDAVEEIRAGWEEQGRRTKALAVSHAFHSPLMEPMLDEFAEVAGSLAYREPKLSIVSNLTGEPLSPEQATDPAYWVRHVREPVRFADAIATLAKQGTSTYLELGPDPVLLAMAGECLGEEREKAAFVPTLREGREEGGAISVVLATAHVSGAKLDWGAFFEGTGAKRVSLPTYPFQRKRYWVGPPCRRAGTDAARLGQSDPGHPLLGAAIETPRDGGLTLTGRISLSTHPWLADHGSAIHGHLARHGIPRACPAGRRAGRCRHASRSSPCRRRWPSPSAGAIAIQVSVSAPGEEGQRQGSLVHSRLEDEEEEWTLNAGGVLAPSRSKRPRAPRRLASRGCRAASRSTTSMTCSPSTGSHTAPPSRASPPPGGRASRSTPRRRCPRSMPRRLGASSSTRPCSTRACTALVLAERGRSAEVEAALFWQERRPARRRSQRPCACASPSTASTRSAAAFDTEGAARPQRGLR